MLMVNYVSKFIVKQETVKNICTSNQPNYWKEQIKTKSKEEPIQTKLVLTCIQILPSFKRIAGGKWSLLKISDKLKRAFKEKPIISYHQNKKLNIIQGTTIENNKVLGKKNGC